MLLPSKLLNFGGGQRCSEKWSQNSPLYRSFDLSLKDSRQGGGNFVMTEFTHAHISRKQPLPFWSPRRVPAWSQPILSAPYCWIYIYMWCHCGPPHWGLSLDKHISLQQTLIMETQPAANLTFILGRFLRWDSSSSWTLQHLWAMQRHVWLFICGRITDNTFEWKWEPRVDFSLFTYAGFDVIHSAPPAACC